MRRNAYVSDDTDGAERFQGRLLTYYIDQGCSDETSVAKIYIGVQIDRSCNSRNQGVFEDRRQL
jgi:hypothetical protein